MPSSDTLRPGQSEGAGLELAGDEGRTQEQADDRRRDERDERQEDVQTWIVLALVLAFTGVHLAEVNDVAYLEDLPRLWRETAPERHRNLAEAMFERIEVLGTREAVIHPTPEAVAHGWRELWGDAVLTSDHRSRYGRGERARADTLRVNVRIVSRPTLRYRRAG